MSARAAAQPISPAEDRARVDLSRFAILAAQLGLLLLVFRLLDIEGPGFFRLSIGCFAGFVIHYFTPLIWKKWVFIALSLVGGFYVLSLNTGAQGVFRILLPASAVALAVTVGIFFFAALRLRAPFWMRLTLVLLVGAVFAYMRVKDFLPGPYFLVLGSIFMFRMILYTYEVKVGRKPETFADFCSYFFLLPNFYFVLFPVIDYTTFKKGYYAQDIHDNAQRGIAWIVRGTIHLMIYRAIYHNLVIGPEDVHSPGTLVQFIVVPFWLYLKVSGHFHIIVGMLHLFGYMLPETNRKYLLASSFTDLWRRINIYWKDFMVKIVYYPAYFRLRKNNETAALVIATLLVFGATTVLHAYQMFWLQGAFVITSADYAFWSILGCLVLFTVLNEARRARLKRAPSNSIAARIASTLGVYLTLTVLWSMWSNQSVGTWIEAITYWR